MIDAHKKAFIEEAVELLSELETTLLEAEKNPDDKELIAKIFRALHTIKGSSGMFGYDDISMFTHDIETVYDKIRNGSLSITKSIIDLTLEACDQISLMLKGDSFAKVNESVTKKIISSFRNIVSGFAKDTSANKISERDIVNGQNDAVKTYLIGFVPAPQIFKTGSNPAMILKELKTFGDAIILGDYTGVPSLENINPENCYASWEILLKSTKDFDAIKDVFIFVEDECDLKIEQVDISGKLNKEEDFMDFESLLVGISKNKRPDIKNLLVEFQSSAEQINPFGSAGETKKFTENSEKHQETEAVSSIRVNAEKLDELVNLVGELVTIQARLNQIAQNNSDQNLISISEEVERLTWSLRDSALNIRMLPIGTTFSRFKRLVRDLSKDLEKEVELTTDGAETELDKTVIEKLSDPLIHIIRNSIDHGIELPAERLKNGKPAKGTVHLSASQSGGNVVIKISDDGAGLNVDQIREKAVKMGMISENDELTESEIFSLIFAAGFSTAKKVTNVSGRGVGMDVVKRAIEGLRGVIEVSSKTTEGTTISLKLPLTLAIIDGLLVTIKDELYVLPLSSVEECIELHAKDITDAHGRHIVNVRGEIIPYVNLRERFEIAGDRSEIEQVVIANINGNRAGFVVDKVIGQHQTVLKTLGKIYRNVQGVSGATILGDGTVALILDIGKLAELEEQEENNRVINQ